MKFGPFVDRRFRHTASTFTGRIESITTKGTVQYATVFVPQLGTHLYFVRLNQTANVGDVVTVYRANGMWYI